MKGSGCGSLGRVVASDTRVPQFKSRHRQKFILNIVYCQLYWKDENKEKRGLELLIKNILNEIFMVLFRQSGVTGLPDNFAVPQ